MAGWIGILWIFLVCVVNHTYSQMNDECEKVNECNTLLYSVFTGGEVLEVCRKILYQYVPCMQGAKVECPDLSQKAFDKHTAPASKTYNDRNCEELLKEVTTSTKPSQVPVGTSGLPPIGFRVTRSTIPPDSHTKEVSEVHSGHNEMTSAAIFMTSGTSLNLDGITTDVFTPEATTDVKMPTGQSGVNPQTPTTETDQSGVNPQTPTTETDQSRVNPQTPTTETGQPGVNPQTPTTETGQPGVNPQTPTTETGQPGVNPQTPTTETGTSLFSRGFTGISISVMSTEIPDQQDGMTNFRSTRPEAETTKPVPSDVTVSVDTIKRHSTLPAYRRSTQISSSSFVAEVSTKDVELAQHTTQSSVNLTRTRTSSRATGSSAISGSSFPTRSSVQSSASTRLSPIGGLSGITHDSSGKMTSSTARNTAKTVSPSTVWPTARSSSGLVKAATSTSSDRSGKLPNSSTDKIIVGADTSGVLSVQTVCLQTLILIFISCIIVT